MFTIVMSLIALLSPFPRPKATLARAFSVQQKGEHLQNSSGGDLV